jgi:hypothetical protein
MNTNVDKEQVMDNYFTTLNSINVNGKTEKKNGLTYLSWAWAWGEVKKIFPDANYTIYENAEGWNYHTDGKTCWVKTGVTVNGIEHIEYLPVMDFKNKSIPANAVTSFDVNKAIQRSLTKAVARHGLGLYIYAGEDLPEDAKDEPEVPVNPPAPVNVPIPEPTTKDYYNELVRLCPDSERLREICAMNGVKSSRDLTKFKFEAIKRAIQSEEGTSVA